VVKGIVIATPGAVEIQVGVPPPKTPQTSAIESGSPLSDAPGENKSHEQGAAWSKSNIVLFSSFTGGSKKMTLKHLMKWFGIR
jgi:hypothetical protein